MSTQIATEGAVNVDQVTEEVDIKGIVKKVGGLETQPGRTLALPKVTKIADLGALFQPVFLFLQIRCVTLVP